MNDTQVLEGTIRPQETTMERVTDVTNIAKSSQSSKRGIVNDQTKTKKWNITPSMYKWVDTAVELITDAPAEISRKCNVSRMSWYRWTTLPGFEEWFYGEYKARRKRWIPQLDRMGMARASKNFDYWKAMNQKAGELIDEGDHQPRQVVSILGGMTLNTVNYNKVQQTSEQQDT